MKKLILFLLIIFLCNFSYAMGIKEIYCDEEGKLTIWVENIGNRNTGKLQVIVENDNLNHDDLPGRWKSNVEHDIYSGSFTRFISNESVLFYKGDYAVSLIYNDTTDSFIEIETLECPGIKYNCDTSKLKIEDCYTKEDQFQFIFSDINEGQVEELTEKDIMYSFRGPKRIWTYDSPPEDLEIKQINFDRYLGKFDTNENITSLRMYITRCGTKEKIIKDCRHILECYNNTSCEENQVCEKDKCEDLNCSTDQEIINHKCINKTIEIKEAPKQIEKEIAPTKEENNTETKIEETEKKESIFNKVIEWIKNIFK